MDNITCHYGYNNAYDRYASILAGDLSDTLLVIPNRRVSDYFLSFDPSLNHIKSIESLSNSIIAAYYPLLGYTVRPTALTAQQQKLILLDVAQQMIPNINAKSSYLQEVYDLIHRIDECGITHDKLLLLSDKLSRQRFRDIIAIIDDYRKHLNEQNKIDYPGMIRLAIELLDNKLSRDDILTLLPVSEIVVSDLHMVSPLGAKLIEKLSGLMGVPLTAYSSPTEDFWTFRGADKEIAKKTPTQILHNTNYRPPEKTANIKQHKFANYEDEALYVALKAASLIHEENIPPSSIILSYRNIRKSSAFLVQELLGKLGITADILTPSSNFYTHPQVSHILHLIMLAHGSDELFNDYFRSPVMALCGDIVDMDVSKVHTLTDTGVFPAEPNELLAQINNKLPPNAPYVIKLNEAIALIQKELHDRTGLSGVLQAIYNKYHVELGDEIFRELLIRANDFLKHNQDIDTIDEIKEFIKFSQDSRFTDDILELRGNDSKVVRIIPFHDIILAHYPDRVKHLFALDMREGSIPMEYNQSELAQPRIFLRVDDILTNKYDNFDMALDALREEKKLFEVLKENTDNLYLSYSRITPDDNDAIPSRFLSPDYDEPEPLGHVYSLLNIEKEQKTKPRYELNIDRYSASFISTYLQCPYKGYMDRCNVNRSISPASLKGTISHRIISDSINGSQKIAVETIDPYWILDYLRSIEEDEYEHYAKYWEEYNKHDREITTSEIKEMLSGWLDYSANRKILSSEESVNFTYPTEEGAVNFTGKLDGVILNKDGSRSIFDIKTGSNNNDVELQIYLYTIGYSQTKPNSTLSTFEVVKSDKVIEYFIKYTDNGLTIEKEARGKKFVNIIPAAKEKIDSAIWGIQQNKWEPKKSKQNCSYCDYKPVCPAWLWSYETPDEDNE